MLRSLFTLLLLLPASVALAGKEARLEGLVNPGHHPQPTWFKNSFLDLTEDVAEARAQGRHLLLYFYQDGCPYCQKLLEVNFSQQAIEAQTQRQFDVIAINMWGDRDVVDVDGEHLSEKDFAAKNQVMFTPTLLFLDQQGGKVLRLNGYYPTHQFRTALDYVAGQHYRTQKFAAYVEQHQHPAAVGQLHSQPFIRAVRDLRPWGQPQSRPLLVLFEQVDCPACAELHSEVLSRAETIQQLQPFDVVQLNMWSRDSVITPQGEELSMRDWARELEINYAPSVLMWREGREVFRMEAYLKAFHVQSALEYVSSGAYLQQPSFQRYIEVRADELRARSVTIELMR